MRQPGPAARSTVVFRYDDYSNFSPIRFEEALIEVFRTRGMSCAFGVIPFACKDQLDIESTDKSRLSAAKARLLKKGLKEGAVELVLHGHSHRARAGRPHDLPPSEFVGLGFQAQKQLLGEGKAHLEELLQVEVKLFAPPWNSYDLHTVSALEELRFECLSAGPRFGAVKKRGALRYLPATCLLPSLREVLNTDQNRADNEAVIVALFHAYDFVEVEPDRGVMSLADLKELLEWMIAREGVKIVSVNSAVETGADLSGRRFALNRSVKKLLALTPPFLRKFYRRTPQLYLSAREAARFNISNLLLIGSLYLIALLLSIPLSMAAVLKLPTAGLGELLRVLGPVFVVAVFIYSMRNARLSYKGAISTLVALGIYLGILIAGVVFPQGS